MGIQSLALVIVPAIVIVAIAGILSHQIQKRIWGPQGSYEIHKMLSIDNWGCGLPPFASKTHTSATGGRAVWPKVAAPALVMPQADTMLGNPICPFQKFNLCKSTKRVLLHYYCNDNHSEIIYLSLGLAQYQEALLQYCLWHHTL